MSRLGSPQAASRRVAIAKPKNDIYVALLAIAVFALLVGTLMLFLEWNEYGRSTTPKVSQAAPGLPWLADARVELALAAKANDAGEIESVVA